MRKYYLNAISLCLLFAFIQSQILPAQSRPFQDTLIICRGDTAHLEGWVNLVQCPCTQGPCSPIVQPNGVWESPTEILCSHCIYTDVSPTTTTLYRQTTPDFRCAAPPPGTGPAPPQGPTYMGALVETLVIVKDCPTPCASTRGIFLFEDCDDGTPFFSCN